MPSENGIISSLRRFSNSFRALSNWFWFPSDLTTHLPWEKKRTICLKQTIVLGGLLSQRSESKRLHWFQKQDEMFFFSFNWVPFNIVYLLILVFLASRQYIFKFLNLIEPLIKLKCKIFTSFLYFFLSFPNSDFNTASCSTVTFAFLIYRWWRS